MSKSIVILAAGMGSRYGGLKQLDQVGPNGETIMDFTLYDAIQNGCTQAVFIIRKDFASDFERQIASKYQDKIQVDLVYQELHSFVPEPLDISKRQKPWGTAHALLMAKNKVSQPFMVVNADDFYGPDAIATLSNFLHEDVSERHYAMVGYPLQKTLSGNGTVSRGICHLHKGGQLSHIIETTSIRAVEGKIIAGEEPAQVLPPNELVSMNLWGLHPSVFDLLEREFASFIREKHSEEKSELYLPFVIDEYLQKGQIEVTVLPTNSKWYGVTYKEDLPDVQTGIQKIISDGTYPIPLWV